MLFNLTIQQPSLLTLLVLNLDSYVTKYWLIYSNLIGLFLIIIFIILIALLFTNNAKYVKFLNLLSAYYLTINLILTSLEYNYTFFNLNLSFNQNTTLFVNLFIFIATVTAIIFFLGISNVFFIQENSKIEFSLLIWFIYISAIFLISSTDFISIIILLECIAFSSYVLVGFERKNKFSTTSALKYLILASVPSGIFILGIALLYNTFGTFSQDYLSILFQNLTLLNFSDSAIVDKNFTMLWKYINEYYFFNTDLINMTLVENGMVLQNFFSYIKTINEFFLLFNPWISAELLYLEHGLLTLKPKICTIPVEAFFLSPETVAEELKDPSSLLGSSAFAETYYYQFLDEYMIVIAQYILVIKELYFFKHLWDLYFNSQISYIDPSFVNFSLSFNKDGGVFKFLAENKLTGILNWFSLMSFAEYVRKFYWFDTDDAMLTNYLAQGIFGTHSAQIVNWLNLYSTILTLKPLDLNYRSFEAIYAIREFLSDQHFLVRESLKTHYLNEIKQALSTDGAGDRISLQLFDNFIETLAPLYVDPMLTSTHSSQAYTYLWQCYATPLWGQDWLYSLYYIMYAELFFYYTDSFLVIYLIILFIIVNLAFKLTAAPFHIWAPSVYGGSPLATLTFLSIFSKLTIMFVMFWMFFNIFDTLYSVWQPILLCVGFLSVIISVLGAFSEKVFKRFFVYSSIGHVGFMLFGVSVLNIDGIKASLDYLILYIISSFIIWFIILHLTKKTTTLVNLKGLSFNQPFLAIIFSITIFSLSGIPPMAGFFVKYEIFYSIINSSFFFFGYILLLLTVISFFYYLRLIKIIFFENNKEFIKNKNLDDIKLRLISILFFIIPFFMLYMENPISYLFYTILIESLR